MLAVIAGLVIAIPGGALWGLVAGAALFVAGVVWDFATNRRKRAIPEGFGQIPQGAYGPTSASQGPIGWTGPAPHLQIVKAEFGRDGRDWADVTKKVRKRVKDGRLDMTASLEDLGCEDPAYGQLKRLRIRYKLNNGPEQSLPFTEGGRVLLP